MSLDHRIAPINFQRNTIHTLWFQRNFTGKLTSNLMTLFFSFLCVWLRQSSSLATAELEISARTSSSYSGFSWFGTINKDHTPLHSWVSSMPHPNNFSNRNPMFFNPLYYICIPILFLYFSCSYVFQSCVPKELQIPRERQESFLSCTPHNPSPGRGAVAASLRFTAVRAIYIW